jgi:hypothetical protein
MMPSPKIVTTTLQPLLTLTNCTNIDFETIMEPTGLISNDPSKRPADIMLHLSTPTKQTEEPISILGITSWI